MKHKTKVRKYGALLMAAALALSLLSGCSKTEAQEESMAAEEVTEGCEEDLNVFRPVDCGLQSQGEYAFPFLGMNVELSELMLEKMDTREVFVYPREDYADEHTITTEVQLPVEMLR